VRAGQGMHGVMAPAGKYQRAVNAGAAESVPCAGDGSLSISVDVSCPKTRQEYNQAEPQHGLVQQARS
jgi:hypothetical protein